MTALTSTAHADTNVRIDVIDVQAGVIVQTIEKHNLVVKKGLITLLKHLGGLTPYPITQFGVGSGGTPVDDTDEILQEEVYRGSLSEVIIDEALKAMIIKFYVPVTQANSAPLLEAGIFFGGDDRAIFARVTHEGFIKTKDIAVIYTWTVALSAIAPA